MRPSYHYTERSDVKAVHLGGFARKPRVTGKDKVYMDIGLFGIGFNLKKYLGIKR